MKTNPVKIIKSKNIFNPKHIFLYKNELLYQEGDELKRIYLDLIKEIRFEVVLFDLIYKNTSNKTNYLNKHSFLKKGKIKLYLHIYDIDYHVIDISKFNIEDIKDLLKFIIDKSPNYVEIDDYTEDFICKGDLFKKDLYNKKRLLLIQRVILMAILMTVIIKIINMIK